MEKSARNCNYLSNRAQNDFIHAMADNVLKEIVEAIKSAEIFTVMMDETTEVSAKEQAAIVIRFVDSEEVIQERLLSFSDVSRTDSDTLFKLLKKSLVTHGLRMSQIRGQCYDGARNMSGGYRGVQARVKEEAPKAVYVHCYAHCLNLVLVDATKKNKMARNFFGTLESLYCFVRHSTYRHALFLYLQAEVEGSEQHATSVCALKKLCETRWACRFEAIKGIRTVRYIGISNGNFERTNAKSYKLSAKFTHNYSLASVFTSHFGFELSPRVSKVNIRLSPRMSKVNIVK